MVFCLPSFPCLTVLTPRASPSPSPHLTVGTSCGGWRGCGVAILTILNFQAKRLALGLTTGIIIIIIIIIIMI
jgi:hypothetical protein